MYVVIDNQSNCSLAKPKLFDLLKLKGATTSYTLRTCSGTSQVEGSHACNLIIESLDHAYSYALPVLTECDAIPDSREEIPSPSVARAYPHLDPITDKISELDQKADILLLIGRARNGPRDAPSAQRLDPGWVVLGNACLDGAHKPSEASCFKTQVLDNGRPSLLLPCSNCFYVRQLPTAESIDDLKEGNSKRRSEDGLGEDVFVRTKDNNKPQTSVEDRKFVQFMRHSLKKSESGNWEAPLPLSDGIEKLPNNREALKRLKSTRCSLDKKPLMKQHYFDFMQKLFDNGQPVTPTYPSLVLTPLWCLPSPKATKNTCGFCLRS